jgi:hypothetical protein
MKTGDIIYIEGKISNIPLGYYTVEENGVSSGNFPVEYNKIFIIPLPKRGNIKYINFSDYKNHKDKYRIVSGKERKLLNIK